MQYSCADVNSPFKTKVLNYSGGPLLIHYSECIAASRVYMVDFTKYRVKKYPLSGGWRIAASP
jgi:hypothetical protein